MKIIKGHFNKTGNYSERDIVVIEIERGDIEEFAELCEYVEEHINNLNGSDVIEFLLKKVDDDIHLFLNSYEADNYDSCFSKQNINNTLFKGALICHYQKYRNHVWFLDKEEIENIIEVGE